MYSLAKTKPWWLVILSGLLLAASFPPSPLGFLSFFAFVPLFILFEDMPKRIHEDRVFLPFKKFWIILFRLLTLQFIWRRNIRVFRYERKEISANAQAFRYTYSAFLIWNLACCYWLMLTMLGAEDWEETLQYFMGGFLAIVINPMLMSLPWQFYMRMKHRLPPSFAALALAFLWVLFEFLHFNWELSWSWLTLGHALTRYTPLLQYMEFTGILGVSLYILIANVLIYTLLRGVAGKTSHSLWRPAAAAVTWLALPLLLNIFIMNPDRAVFKPSGSMRVRVIQPNISPYSKFENITRADQYKRFYELLTAAPLDSVELAVLPETALTRAGGMDRQTLSADPMMAPLWSVVDSHQLSILSGMTEVRFFIEGIDEIPVSAAYTRRGWLDAYNAATMLTPDRSLLIYEKGKLVPFVERVPFLGALTALKECCIDLTAGFSGYGLPDSLVMLKTHNGTPVGTMICYESEFGEYSAEQVRRGAKLLTIITNDGWWSKSSGYIQHAYFARLRAIETRRDIARSANTGRSLFVDSKGVITHETNWWEPAMIEKEVNLYESQTFYVRHGDYLGWVALGGSIVMLVVAVLRRK